MVPKPASMEAPPVPFDLVIHAGRVVCPATGLDGPGAVAVAGGRIAAAGPGVDGPAREVLRLPDAVLLPGLVDLHAHPARGESRYGVDPDVHLLPFGTTTVLAQGEAGALNLARYRRRRHRALADAGPAGSQHLAPRRGDARRLLRGARRTSTGRPARRPSTPRGDKGVQAIWGIAVNVSQATCGRTDPRAVMTAALVTARGDGTPAPVRAPARGRLGAEEQLALLRPGDVVTYCFTDCPEGLLAGDRVRDEIWAARERGIHFDVGHGMGSFSFRVAELAVAQGFLPDAVSTDRYQRHLGLSPRHDLPRTLSKLLAAGMAEPDAFARATARPAAILGLGGEVGTLAPGASADLAALGWNPAAPPLRDTSGAERPGGVWEPVLTVRAGTLVHPAPARAGAPA